MNGHEFNHNNKEKEKKKERKKEKRIQLIEQSQFPYFSWNSPTYLVWMKIPMQKKKVVQNQEDDWEGNVEIKKIGNWYYKVVRPFKFPISVGIVPENWFDEMFLNRGMNTRFQEYVSESRIEEVKKETLFACWK